MINVFDLDGCVINSLHRYRTKSCGTRIDLKYWRENCTPEQIMKDTLLPLAGFYKRLVNQQKEKILIATSRVMSDTDFSFIKAKLAGYDALIHRINDNDARRGFILKCQGIMAYVNEFGITDKDIRIYDDNEQQLSDMKAVLNYYGFNTKVKHIPSHQGH